MKLKSIEINGFKSFADRVKLNFDSNITAIIGPNGSGKSNVSDAVRWVLGEQSIKTLRGNKMEDVIFSGTDKKAKKNFASVSITFDNSDNLIPIDFKEVTVSRRLYRTGESEYSINKSIVRLKEIKELFLDTGIGKEGYSLIGQGRIEEIINGKSEDRRVIFESACGTLKIKYQKNESEKKLIRSKENLIRLKDIILQNERRCEFLRTQSDKAKKGKELLDKIEKAEFSIFYNDYNNYTLNIEKYNNNLSSLKKEYDDVSKELQELKQKLNPLKDKLSGVLKIIDHSNKELLEDNIKKTDLINRKKILLERNKFILENKNNIFSLNEENKKNILEISKDVDKIKVSLDEKNSIRKNFLSSRNSIKIDLEEKQINLKENLISLDNIKKEKVTLEDKINLLETEKKANDIIKENIEKQILLNEQQILELNLKKNEFFQKISLLKTELEEKKEKFLDLENLILSSSNKESEYIKEIDQLKKENLNINNEILYKEKEISMIKNYIRNYEGYNKSVQDLFKFCEKEPKVKEMICGTLGDLIFVEEKYKKAIDTVLSSNLQGIIVNDDVDAKFIIEKMKENKIGRLNFFPISKIFSKNENFSINDNNILSFANEVVSCDDKYRNIVNYFLSKTVICDNLNIAIEISKKYKNKFRIVTLDADLINSWGSISGGYKSSKSSFSVIGRKNMLNNLLKEVENLKHIFEKNKQNIINLEEKLSINKEKNLDLKNKKEEFSKDFATLDKEIYKNNLEVNQISDKILEIESFKTQKDGFSIEKEKELKKDKELIVKVNSDLKKLEDVVVLMKDAIYSLEKKEINAINDLDFVDRDINILLNKKMELIENKNVLETKITSNDKELLNFDLQIKSNLKETESIDKSALELSSKIENLNRIISENEKLKVDLSLENDKFSNRFSALNESFFFLENEVEKNEMKISNTKSQLEALFSKLSEEYGINDEEIAFKMEKFKSEKFTKETLKKLKEELRNLGTFSIESIEEYDKVKSELDFQKKQEEDLKNSIEDINKIISKLENEIKKTFLKEFENINERFSNIFKILFQGGQASLKLDGDDILTCGIDIVAQPVGKKLQTLTLLSGGEKSLTAVALLFAIFETNPSPFCILDEVDAALDDSNILRYIDYLKTFLHKTQFIMITHRKPTMEMADMLYGVTMQEKGISKIVSMKFDERK